MQTCRHEHEHYSTPWTIYVVDPQVATDVNKYGDALYPIDSFDTKEEVENLYRLRAFSEPNGPPSWSMVVEGGAIAVFQGGKFGYPSVAPKWEDPAAHNGKPQSCRRKKWSSWIRTVLHRYSGTSKLGISGTVRIGKKLCWLILRTRVSFGTIPITSPAFRWQYMGTPGKGGWYLPESRPQICRCSFRQTWIERCRSDAFSWIVCVEVLQSVEAFPLQSFSRPWSQEKSICEPLSRRRVVWRDDHVRLKHLFLLRKLHVLFRFNDEILHSGSHIEKLCSIMRQFFPVLIASTRCIKSSRILKPG